MRHALLPLLERRRLEPDLAALEANAGAEADLRLVAQKHPRTVAEGLAIVSASGGRAEVKAGEQATIAADGAPKVAPVAFWDDWTGGMGDRGGGGLRSGVGSGALYAVDRSGPPGAPALPLAIQRQTVKIAIEGDLAEVSTTTTTSPRGIASLLKSTSGA